jgi:hypothetical protein
MGRHCDSNPEFPSFSVRSGNHSGIPPQRRCGVRRFRQLWSVAPQGMMQRARRQCPRSRLRTQSAPARRLQASIRFRFCEISSRQNYRPLATASTASMDALAHPRGHPFGSRRLQPANWRMLAHGASTTNPLTLAMQRAIPLRVRPVNKTVALVRLEPHFPSSFGASRRIRTYDLRLRRPTLYPAELATQ